MATRCKHSTAVPWIGHTAVLKYVKCKNMTKHPSGYCHVHRREHDSAMSSEQEKDEGSNG